MSAQDEFIACLKSVMVHLIKHDQALYKDFTGVIKTVDDDRWFRLNDDQKRDVLNEMSQRLPQLEGYYAEYPHGWSKSRYEDFKVALDACQKELAE